MALRTVVLLWEGRIFMLHIVAQMVGKLQAWKVAKGAIGGLLN
jgi:hypothetical protein